MVDITLIELDVEEASFSAHAPFSGKSNDQSAESEAEEETTDDGAAVDDSGGGRGKAPVVLGVVLLVVVVAALARLLSGDDDEPDVEIETADDGPVGVTVDTDEE